MQGSTNLGKIPGAWRVHGGYFLQAVTGDAGVQHGFDESACLRNAKLLVSRVLKWHPKRLSRSFHLRTEMLLLDLASILI
jgi:hypothetical protein